MKWIEWLLKLYPATFREQYARDILLNIRDMHQDVQASEGRVAAQVFLLRSGMDVVQVAVKEQTKANFRMTHQTFVLSVGLVLTLSGTVLYGQMNYQRQQPNPAILSWMDPVLKVDEVSSDPMYRPLIDALEDAYSTTKIKIWKVNQDYGFLRGKESRLMVSVLTRDLEQPLNKRNQYPSIEVLNALWKKANALTPDKEKMFKKRNAQVAMVLQSVSFEPAQICLTTPLSQLNVKVGKKTGTVLSLSSYTTASVMYFPASADVQKNLLGDQKTRTVFSIPEVQFLRNEYLPGFTKGFSHANWYHLPLDQEAGGCNFVFNRWPDGP